MKKRAGIMRKALIHIAKNKRWYLIGLICASILSLFLPLYTEQYYVGELLTRRQNCIDIFSYAFHSHYFDLIFWLLLLGILGSMVGFILLLLNKRNFFLLFGLSFIPFIITCFCSIKHLSGARNFDASIGTYLLLLFSVLYTLILFLREKEAKSK